MSDLRANLKAVLTGPSIMSPEDFGSGIQTLALRMGVGLDDPLLSDALMGKLIDEPSTCLQHAIIWHTTSCVIPVYQAASFLSELHRLGADPAMVDQGFTAWDVLVRGVREHGSWAGDLSALGTVLMRSGEFRMLGHNLDEACEILMDEGQASLANVLLAHVHALRLDRSTPQTASSSPRRSL